jgi:energy-coupling factor transporter ATP-binding protein EcfA2
MSEASIEQLVLQHLNPFDPNTFKPGNFWLDPQDPKLNVESIHQEVLDSICATLAALKQDGTTRTLLLTGESGSGKSHLLGRLKNLLNPQAFFAYIGPWPDSQFIWRHVLRNAVDSLLEIPEGQGESQLLLWLQGLLRLQTPDFNQRVFGKRRIFIRTLCTIYPRGIYNPTEFFGVLYDLTNPELDFLATSWLRGDNLDEESCAELRVRQPIDSEDAAQKILSNFGKISTATQPIILCFDNLDNLPHLPSGNPDFQSLFNVNSSIHNQKLPHFLILASIVTNTWKQNRPLVQPADLARINQTLQLKSITLDQAEVLWANRLHGLHVQLDPPPDSALEPLHRDWLEQEFPSGRTLPRNALVLGQRLIDRFKHDGNLPMPRPSTLAPASVGSGNSQADFELVWHNEFKKVQGQITRLTQLTSPDLIWRLQELLQVLQLPGLRVPFLDSSAKFAAYSLCFRSQGITGVVWTEDQNMSFFFHVMKACEKILQTSRCERLYLIRSTTLGRRTSKGYKLFQHIFKQDPHQHLQPDLASIHFLETYHNLVNAACGRELVVGQHVPDLHQLQAMMRGSGLLHQCQLLQALGLVIPPQDEMDGLATLPQEAGSQEAGSQEARSQEAGAPDAISNSEHHPNPFTNDDATNTDELQGQSNGDAKDGDAKDNDPTEGDATVSTLFAKETHHNGHSANGTANLTPNLTNGEVIIPQAMTQVQQAKRYLHNLVTTQKLMGIQVLINQGCSQFPDLPEGRVTRLVQELCHDGKIQKINPDAKKRDQLVCCIMVDKVIP